MRKLIIGIAPLASEAEDSADTAGGSVTTAPIEHSASVAAAIAAGDAPAGDLKALDFDAGKSRSIRLSNSYRTKSRSHRIHQTTMRIWQVTLGRTPLLLLMQQNKLLLLSTPPLRMASRRLRRRRRA